MKIFFSHSSTDKALVREIKSKMYDFLDIWIDEKELIIGESLENEISKAIDNADYMVLFISKKALESDWVNKEIELALEKEKRTDKPFILPILINQVEIPNKLSHKLYLTSLDTDYLFLSEKLNETLFHLFIKYNYKNKPLYEKEILNSLDDVMYSLETMFIRLNNAINSNKTTYTFDEESKNITNLYLLSKRNNHTYIVQKLEMFQSNYNQFIKIFNDAIKGDRTIDDINSFHKENIVEWFYKNIYLKVNE